jgi:hypothetical protein
MTPMLGVQQQKSHVQRGFLTILDLDGGNEGKPDESAFLHLLRLTRNLRIVYNSANSGNESLPHALRKILHQLALFIKKTHCTGECGLDIISNVNADLILLSYILSPALTMAQVLGF